MHWNEIGNLSYMCREMVCRGLQMLQHLQFRGTLPREGGTASRSILYWGRLTKRIFQRKEFGSSQRRWATTRPWLHAIAKGEGGSFGEIATFSPNSGEGRFSSTLLEFWLLSSMTARSSSGARYILLCYCQPNTKINIYDSISCRISKLVGFFPWISFYYSLRWQQISIISSLGNCIVITTVSCKYAVIGNIHAASSSKSNLYSIEIPTRFVFNLLWQFLPCFFHSETCSNLFYIIYIGSRMRRRFYREKSSDIVWEVGRQHVLYKRPRECK